LKAIVAPLPENVRLAEVRLAEQAETRAPSEGVQAPAAGGAASVAVKRSPAEDDLEQLREHQDRLRVTLDVIGFAQDAAALHRYVDQLSQAPLVASAQLRSLEAVTMEGQPPQTRFEVHLALRPGHGQIGGPETPAPAAATVATSGTIPAGGPAR
jgi:hypothetical protein